jgi:hypothetical protein
LIRPATMRRPRLRLPRKWASPPRCTGYALAIAKEAAVLIVRVRPEICRNEIFPDALLDEKSLKPAIGRWSI